MYACGVCCLDTVANCSMETSWTRAHPLSATIWLYLCPFLSNPQSATILVLMTSQLHIAVICYCGICHLSIEDSYVVRNKKIILRQGQKVCLLTLYMCWLKFMHCTCAG